MDDGELDSGFKHGAVLWLLCTIRVGESELKNLSGGAIVQVADWSSVVHSDCFTVLKVYLRFFPFL